MTTRNQSLLDYLEREPPEILDGLYNSPWTCRSIFRCLKPLEKQYIMRLLYIEIPFPVSKLSNWVKPNYINIHEKALAKLTRLHIATIDNFVDKYSRPTRGIVLNKIFQLKLREALLISDVSPWPSNLSKDKEAPTIEKLDHHGRVFWERVLHVMTGDESRAYYLSEDIMKLLIDSRLIEDRDGRGVKTEKGYQFLLKDSRTQVWTLLLSYIDNCTSKNLNRVEILAFLFQLNSLTLGKDYPIDGLTESQKKFVKDLREFGLIFQTHTGSRRFYPTRISINLASGQDYHQQHEGYIIVETNNRVYAYVQSELQIQLLSLFCKLKYRIANFVIGVITRNKVQEAIDHGISADLIIEYLEQNAHPETKKEGYPLPEVLVDQIRIWEGERGSVTYESAAYFAIADSNLYSEVKKFAEDSQILLWSNVKKGVIVVTSSGQNDIKNFVASQRQNNFRIKMEPNY